MKKEKNDLKEKIIVLKFYRWQQLQYTKDGHKHWQLVNKETGMVVINVNCPSSQTPNLITGSERKYRMHMRGMTTKCGLPHCEYFEQWEMEGRNMRKYRYSQAFRIEESNGMQSKECFFQMSFTEHNINKERIQNLFDAFAYKFSDIIKEEIEDSEYVNSRWNMEGSDGYEI